MKKTKIIYWVVTGLFAAFMLFSAVPNVMKDAQSIELISKQLGFPEYFIPFIGVGKILGVIAILIPGFPRVKEWAYAGLTFDLVAATYAALAVWGFSPEIAIMFLFPAFGLLSYFLYHKVRRETEQRSATATTVTA